MICPDCQHENRPSARFCARCRTRLQRVCPDCGTEVAPDDRFCDSCGADLASASAAPVPSKPPSVAEQFTTLQEAMPSSLRDQILIRAEGENRVVTVLFADMSRSVEMTRDLPPDEAADLVNRLLKAMVDALVQYEGRVDRFLGDGALAVFGAPQAHESDPERAILAAIEIRKAARALELEVTAGINTGEVYAGGIGSERHQEVTVMGPAVNLAARLQDLAEPGAILVGEATYRQTRRAFEFAPRVLDVKGIDYPVTAYEMLRPLPRPEKVRGIEGLRADLIGRHRELALLIDAADTLVQERRGQIVSLVGEAGIGKSRLVSELKTYLEGEAIRWLEGRCISIGQSVSFWPFIDMMRAYLGISGEDKESDIADRLVRSMTDLFQQDADGVIPYVGQMLSVKLDERYQERVRHAAPEQIRRQTLLRMRDLFVALARRQPLVVILEDLHWADDLSLDLLWVLMDELVAAPILLLCVYRPEREHGCWQIDSAATNKHLERYTPLFLKPLTPQESEQMVESLLDIQDLPPSARAAILENTEGNPFFVEEVVRLLIEQGAIYREEGHWKAREAIGELAVPDTVKSVILSRIDRLHTEVRHVLQCASVIGRVFQRRLLEYLSGQKEALEVYLAQLETYDLVYKERTVPELEYAFKHALTQETAYEAILSRYRKTFHERVGEAIESLYQEQIEEYYELLAFHYSRSNNREKAIEYLVKAGDKAAARYANQEALTYYENALKLAAEGDASDVILTRRAKLHTALFHGQEAVGDFTRLLESSRRSGDRRQELEALLGLANAHYIVALDGQEPEAPARSRALYEAAYVLARELEDRASMVHSLVPTVWFVDFWREYRDQAAANVEEALALSQELGVPELILHSKLARYPYLARPENDEEERELFDWFEARHDLIGLRELYYKFMWIHLSGGHFERAVVYCDAGIRLAHETGVPPVQYSTIKAFALMRLGRYGEARASLEEEVTGTEHRLGSAMKELGTGTYCLELLAYERAAEIFERVIEHARKLRRAWMAHSAQTSLLVSLIRADRLDEATLSRLTQGPDGLGAALPLDLQAEIFLYRGRLEEALRTAQEACAQAEQGRLRSAFVRAAELALRVLLQMGRASEAVELAGKVLPMAEEMRYLPLLWRIRAARAQAGTMLGSTDAAVQDYRAAAEVIQSLTATIADPELRQTFEADPRVSAVLTTAAGGG